ncbi:hypothetical protein SESBI_42272 [Sesbania bispinosa]|nr:hypothetical protein SESBI_42272 [Sesbania bispinosa]
MPSTTRCGTSIRDEVIGPKFRDANHPGILFITTLHEACRNYHAKWARQITNRLPPSFDYVVRVLVRNMGRAWIIVFR